MEAFLSERGLSHASLYPMVRGRLVKINGRRVSKADYDKPRAQRLVQREFNLSWAATLAPDNHVVRGRWWVHRGDFASWIPPLVPNREW